MRRCRANTNDRTQTMLHILNKKNLKNIFLDWSNFLLWWSSISNAMVYYHGMHGSPTTLVQIPYWVNPSKRVGTGEFSKGWQGCSEGFPEVKPEENPKEQACFPKENPVLPNSFTWIYILFPIGFLTFLNSISIFLCKANLFLFFS